MLPILELVRLEENYDYGTFGCLLINKELFCWTLEPRDEENANDISSIPAQQYICKRYSSDKYIDTFEVTNVPNRDKILFHAGNYAGTTKSDTLGCILLGSSIGNLKEHRVILNSGRTFAMFMNKLDEYKTLHLTIKECY